MFSRLLKSIFATFFGLGVALAGSLSALAQSDVDGASAAESNTFVITDDGIVGPDLSEILADGSCTFSNDVGGPRSPAVCRYNFRNTLSLNRRIDFTASENVNGLSISPTSGSIANGSTRTFEITTNGAAILAPGGRTLTGTATMNFEAALFYSETKTLDLTLNIRKKAGDDLGSATNLSSSLSSFVITTSNQFYTTQSGEPKHYPGASANNVRSRWFRWVAPSTGQMKFWTSGDTNIDTVLAVYNLRGTLSATSILSNLGKVGADDNSQGGNKSAVWFHAVSGEVYYIVVASRTTSTPTGSIRLNRNRPSGNTSGLVASVLPRARGVRTNLPATAFGTVINTSGITARKCYLSPLSSSSIARDFQYQTTTPANTPTGFVNRPVDIPAGAAQNFVFAYTPKASESRAANIVFDCENMAQAPVSSALNTFRFVSNTTQPADMIAAAVTTSNDGIVRIPGSTGTGAFSVAVLNNDGPPTTITARPVKVGSYPASVSVCRTNPSTGICITPIGSAVSWTAQPNQPYTFTVFATGSGVVPFNPAQNRIDLQLLRGSVIHGLTGVAVRTQ